MDSRSRGRTLTEEQREQAATAAANVSPMRLRCDRRSHDAAVHLLVLFLTALYYTIVSFVTHDGMKLKQWFALCCWCTLPSVLGLVAQLVNLSVNDARFMIQDTINPLSFGNLLSIERTGATHRSADPARHRHHGDLDYRAVTSSATRRGPIARSTKSVAVVLGPLAADRLDRDASRAALKSAMNKKTPDHPRDRRSS